jgi:uncharacterized protein with HEPN domain
VTIFIPTIRSEVSDALADKDPLTAIAIALLGIGEALDRVADAITDAADQ